jgi:hypothetical protein
MGQVLEDIQALKEQLKVIAATRAARLAAGKAKPIVPVATPIAAPPEVKK